MRSPFKFLDAYTLEDREFFFGREEEVAELYRMVTQNRLILVYGESGSGKTSLVQCGLAGRFDATDWFPLYIRRSLDINQVLDEQLRESLDGDLPGSYPEIIEEIFAQHLRPVYLLFDQLEELFILGSREEQNQFIQTISEILNANLPCRIIFILREEYLGQLYHFEKVIPTLLDRRLRVEPMSLAKVSEVIERSAEKFNIGFEDKDHNIKQIIHNLSGGKSLIPLTYLQVFLDMLWREDYERTYSKGAHHFPGYPRLKFTTKEIEEFGAIENVLQRFLTQQEASLQQELKKKHKDIPDDAVRRVLDVFVTEQGTKKPVSFDRHPVTRQIYLEESAGKLIPDFTPLFLTNCLNGLQSRRLVRYTDHTIELAHDTLAALIDELRTDEQRQLNRIKDRIQSYYEDFPHTKEYLSSKQLNTYEDYFPKLDLEPPVQKYIEASYQHARELQDAEQKRQKRELELAQQKLAAEQKILRRQRFFLVLVGIIALAAIALGIWANQQRREAIKATKAAQIASFDSQISAARTLKIQGQYSLALNQLDQLDSTMKETNLEEEKAKLDSITNLFRQVYSLVARGDSLMGTDMEENLNPALESYSQAYTISPDNLINNKMNDLKKDIDEKYDRYIRSGDTMKTFGRCQAAIRQWQNALVLKPGDAVALEKIESCGE